MPGPPEPRAGVQGTRETVVARVRRLRGVSYAWREGEERRGRTGGEREVGVIAQDVETVFPELVDTAPDGYKRVDYLGLVPVLIEALKELDERLLAVEGHASQPQPE